MLVKHPLLSIRFSKGILLTMCAGIFLAGSTTSETPGIIFNREIVQDNVFFQPTPFEDPSTPSPSPSPDIISAMFQRFLGLSVDAFPQDLFDRNQFSQKKIKVDKDTEIINITTKNTPSFARGIYVLKQNRIIGYALAEKLQLFEQKDPPILREIAFLPENQNAFSEYYTSPSLGKLDIREKNHGSFVEYYAVYVSPEGGSYLILDAFYPRALHQRLKKPIGRALARYLRVFDKYYTELLYQQSLPENELDFVDDPGPEMD